MAPKNPFDALHDAFHAKDQTFTASPNRSMSGVYHLDTTSLMPKKPQTPAQHASVRKAAAASVAKRRGEMPLAPRPIKSFMP